jgi:hypothetical protein
MAGVYKIGTNRIVYRAKGFQTGLAVTVFVWDPQLENKSTEITLTEVGHGLYFFVFKFTQWNGTYHAVFFEDGVESAYNSFRVVPKLT